MYAALAGILENKSNNSSKSYDSKKTDYSAYKKLLIPEGNNFGTSENTKIDIPFSIISSEKQLSKKI